MMTFHEFPNPAPDAILTPEGILDDGGELTLAEAAEALYATEPGLAPPEGRR